VTAIGKIVVKNGKSVIIIFVLLKAVQVKVMDAFLCKVKA